MSENIKAQPEALRSFAGRLSQFSQEMQTNQATLRSQFNAVSNTWRDSVQAQFAQELQEAGRILDQFIQQINEQHIPYVKKKADQIDEYLQGGL